jgi:hypothetical protein
MSASDLIDRDLTEVFGEQAQKQSRAAALAYRLFVQSDDGAEFLQFMRDNFTALPVLTADSTQFGAGIREGQNTVVRYIEWLCREHEQANNLEEGA